MGEVANTADQALLKFIVQQRLVSADAVHAAQAEVTADASGALIDHLVLKGLVSEESIAFALSKHLRLPFVDLAALSPDAQVIRLVREDLANRHRVVPLNVEQDRLVVAIANPLDREGLRALEFATGRHVRPVIATASAVKDALGRAYHLDEALNAYLGGVSGDADVPVAELKDEMTDWETLQRESALPPVVKLFNLILLDGIRGSASDVHIEPGLNEVRVRYRIDGMLHESLRLPKWVHEAVVARCKVLANLDITERRVPQDGRIRIHHREALIDLRVSSLPTQFGEKVTIRILNSSSAPTGLDHLALGERDLRCMRQAIMRPQGMVLVTGPTGSGKSTTLYSMLGELISPTRNIVTIENPIEYQVRGVNQVQINERQGLTFASTLRSILRQDPDVILVGEIRDAETAQIAVQAAQTGHLVLSTLHTNDSVATLARLSDLGIDASMISSSLNLVVAQRLVRRICTRCAQPYEPDASLLKALKLTGKRLAFRRGVGCAACRKLGYAGREAVFEVMAMSGPMAKLIEAKASESALRAQARQDGLIPLAEQATQKVVEGLTTVEEVMRVVDVGLEANRCPTCDRQVEDTFAVCPHCSTPLRTRCPNCNTDMQKEWAACPYCGAPAAPPQTARPKRLPGPEPEPEPAGDPVAAARPLQYRVLVVDDDPDFLRLMTLFLRQSDLPITVLTASTGTEALERAENSPPDLILLDVMMPNMDGFEVCARLRANLRTAFVPILMLTALNDPDSRTRGFLVGTDDYISKPFDRQELLARVRRVLQRTYGTGPRADIPVDVEVVPPAERSQRQLRSSPPVLDS
jgi:type IV pilus assembly protein PilB